MLTKIYPAAIVALVLLAVFQWGNVDTLSGELKKANESLGSCKANLVEATDEITTQNDRIMALQQHALDSVLLSGGRVEEVLDTLPVNLERDLASPATAAELNQWMGGLFH